MKDGGGGAPRKKILLGVTTAAWGGAQRYVFDIASNLPALNFEIAVMAGKEGRLFDLLREQGIRCKRIPALERSINPLNEIRSFISIFKIIRTEQPDVLHLNSPKMAGIGGVAGKILGVPNIIITVHGWSFGKEWPAVARAAIYLFSWISSILADRIICITRRDFEAAQKMPFMQKKAVLIPNGINFPEYLAKDDARRALIEKGGLPDSLMDEMIWLGTITRFIKEKDIETMIRGVARLKPGIPLVILGTGPDEKRMRALAEEIAPNKIFFLGFVPNAEIYLKAFSIFLLTSIKEGLPYVLLEAGGAAVPLIATDVGGIPDIVENRVSGALILPRNPDILASAIENAVGSPEGLIKWEKAAAERVKNGFNLSRMLEETVELYR